MLRSLSALGSDSKDVNERIIDTTESIAPQTIKLPTQLGFSFTTHYFSKDSNSEHGSLDPFFFIGPGFFFDYKINQRVTLSLESYYLYDANKVYDSSKAYRLGFFSKHWISSGWGYVGFGVETLFFQGKYNRESYKHKDIMFSVLLTGENVHINKKVSSSGDLRFGISFYNDKDYEELRFGLQYNIGIGFALQ